MKTPAELVATLRKNGYTLEGIAQGLETSMTTVFRWSKGKTKPIKSLRAKLEELAEKSQGPRRKSP